MVDSAQRLLNARERRSELVDVHGSALPITIDSYVAPAAL